jgi:hypothetical protein
VTPAEVIGVVLGFVGLFLTIVSSAVGIAAWLATKITRLETKMEQAFTRLGVLEQKPAARRAVAGKKKR